ncbi:MAG: NrfD/PsrC family molybdoenzyme membrane anchor subunit [Coriobacteriales bacterium]|jgi:protein NrfD
MKTDRMSVRFWTWPIATYLFLGGLGGGTLFMSGIFYFLGLGSPLGFGIFVGIVMLALGCLLLVFELGQPKLFTRAFIAKTAIIKWGAVLLSVALICGFFWWWFYFPPEWNCFWYGWTGLENFWALLTMVASMGLMIYTGILLSSMKSRPFWNTPAVPIIFTISASSTGCALLALCLQGSPIDWWMFQTTQTYLMSLGDLYQIQLYLFSAQYIYEMLHLIDTILIVFEIMFLLLFVIMQYSSSNVVAKKVAKRWLTGSLMYVFWIGMIIVGLFCPLGCYLIGGDIAAGYIAPILVLCSGLLLRFLFVYNNDRRGIPGEQKYYDRLPEKDDPIFSPYWEEKGGIY